MPRLKRQMVISLALDVQRRAKTEQEEGGGAREAPHSTRPPSPERSNLTQDSPGTDFMNKGHS